MTTNKSNKKSMDFFAGLWYGWRCQGCCCWLVCFSRGSHKCFYWQQFFFTVWYVRSQDENARTFYPILVYSLWLISSHSTLNLSLTWCNVLALATWNSQETRNFQTRWICWVLHVSTLAKMFSKQTPTTWRPKLSLILYTPTFYDGLSSSLIRLAQDNAEPTLFSSSAADVFCWETIQKL